VSDICAFAGRCGGCTYIHIPYAQELAIKENTLRETLGAYSPLLEEIHPAPHTDGYRNKMELAFGDDGGQGDTRKLALGIRKKRSFYEVATTENCVLMPADFKKIAAFAMQFFQESPEAVYHRKKATGTLRHLVLRRGHFTGEILVVLSTTSGLTMGLHPFIQGLRDLPLDGSIVGIGHTINDGVADAVKSEHLTLLWGQDFYREKLCGLTFHVSAFSFFQTNSAGAELLYNIVREMAVPPGAPPALAYDLYCGTGTIAQIITPYFEQVIGIELFPDTIASAQKNAQLNGITNCQFHTGDISHIALQSSNKTPDAIVVDPPRDGLSPKALAKIAALSPTRLVYVSCKPASLARDLPTLANAGLTPTRIVGVDLFPRTPHIEAICLLQRENLTRTPPVW